MKNRFDSLKDNTNPFKREGKPRKSFNSEHERNHDRNSDRNSDRNFNRNSDRNFNRNSDRNFNRNSDRNSDRNFNRNFTRPSHKKNDSSTPNNFIVKKPPPPPTFNMEETEETDFPALEGIEPNNNPIVGDDKYRSVATQKIKVDRTSSSEVQPGQVRVRWASNKIEMTKGPPGNWEIERAEREKTLREEQKKREQAYYDNYDSDEIDDYFDY